MLRFIVLFAIIVGTYNAQELKSCHVKEDCVGVVCDQILKCLWNKCLCYAIPDMESADISLVNRLEGHCISHSECSQRCHSKATIYNKGWCSEDFCVCRQ